MRWGRPRNVWQWLLVLTPAAEMIAVQPVADRWGTLLFGDSETPGMALAILNVVAVFAFSLALGISWFWPSPDWADRLVKGGAVGMAIAVVNIAIGTVGCRIGDAFFSKR